MITDVTAWAVLLRRLRARGRSPPTTPATKQGIDIGETAAGDVVSWPAPSREHASHVAVLASSGAGKTTVVAGAIVAEFAQAIREGNREDDRASYLVVDPKGDLVDLVLSGVAARAPDRLCDVEYLEPFRRGCALNLARLSLRETPIDIRAFQLANMVAEVSTARGSQKHLGVGARQVDVLEHLLLAALDTEHADRNVLWALDALATPKAAKTLSALTRSHRARDYLLAMKLSDELRASAGARLRSAFAATSQLERLVAAPSCLDFAAVLSPGKLCLVDLGRPPGGMMNLVAFYANLFVRLAAEFLLERPSPWTGHHARIIVDEAQVVAPVLDDIAESILTTGRSRGLSLVTLSQGTVLLDEASKTLLGVLLTNTPTKLIGRLSAPDAERLSREQAIRPGIDEPVSALRSRFAGSVCNLADREFFLLRPGTRERLTARALDLAAWGEARSSLTDAIRHLLDRHALSDSGKPRVTLADLSARSKPGAREAKPAASDKTGSRWG